MPLPTLLHTYYVQVTAVSAEMNTFEVKTPLTITPLHTKYDYSGRLFINKDLFSMLNYVMA